MFDNLFGTRGLLRLSKTTVILVTNSGIFITQSKTFRPMTKLNSDIIKHNTFHRQIMW